MEGVRPLFRAMPAAMINVRINSGHLSSAHVVLPPSVLLSFSSAYSWPVMNCTPPTVGTPTLPRIVTNVGTTAEATVYFTADTNEHKTVYGVVLHRYPSDTFYVTCAVGGVRCFVCFYLKEYMSLWPPVIVYMV